MRKFLIAALFCSPLPAYGGWGVTPEQQEMLDALGPLDWNDPAAVAAEVIGNCYGDDCYDLFTYLCQENVEDPGTTIALSECRAIEAAAWQQEIDTTTALLRGHYAEDGGGTHPAFEAVITAWEAYRKARCDFEMGKVNGTMTGLAYVTCLAETNARHAHFLSLYDN